ncbi:MAG: NAD-dependent epimerase/dehydratase family protein [Candidatus Thermoplasmatota archaeon]|nr:NAD-dependent epimerase/dehydratase family protein [Candidatus Thermoplasmatota archaeon]
MTETRQALITGGAGFIGSHLVDRFVDEGWEVTVYDNFTSGKRSFLEGSPATVVEADCLDAQALIDAASGCEVIVHAAADPDVRIGVDNPTRHFEQNVVATQNALEAARENGVSDFLFLSTSTIYGEADVFPTPEDFGPLKPISTYGASKLACEAICSGHASTFEFNTGIYRFANILGPRLTHGVIYDFVHKLRKTPDTLEILGDGSQDKSYCHIDDMVEAIWTTLTHPEAERPVGIYNVGTDDSTTVTRIADLVCEAMGLEDVTYDYTGGVDGGRGWKGDVKRMLLANDRLKKLGWSPAYTSDEAVKATAAWCAENA